MKFEEQYEDVLQNLEFSIVQVYRRYPELTDWDVLNAVEALIRDYQAEIKGREPRPPSLQPLSEEVYELTGGMCEVRLGRETFYNQDDEPVGVGIEPISLEELVACLKRIRKSINLWTREGGRQGYLDYVDQFLL